MGECRQLFEHGGYLFPCDTPGLDNGLKVCFGHSIVCLQGKQWGNCQSKHVFPNLFTIQYFTVVYARATTSQGLMPYNHTA